MHKEKYVVMYHWSDQAPKTSPSCKYKYRGFEEKGNIIFLTKNPRAVGLKHGKENKKYLYVIRVPRRVQKKALFDGTFDGAHECVLSEEQWQQCKIIGKKKKKEKERIVDHDADFLTIFKKEWELGTNTTNQHHLSRKEKVKILKTKIPSLIRKKEEKIKIVKEISQYTNVRNAFEIYRKVIEGFSVKEALQLVE
jgi:hypothetical protein